MKPEFITVNGTYIGLAPKSYIITNDDDTENVKRANKGIYFEHIQMNCVNIFLQPFNYHNSGVPSDIQLSLETFKRALFNKEAPKVEVNSLLLNRQKEMTRVKFQKIGLTDVSLKYFIHEDLISGTPFQKDGKYL